MNMMVHLEKLFNVVDNIMKQRIEDGMGVVKNSTPISLCMEEEMWRSGILGKHNPKQLSDTMVYILGLNLALRGGIEQKHLRRPGFQPQLSVGHDSDGVHCLIYAEDPKSKNKFTPNQWF